MDSFGDQALQSAEVVDDTNLMDVEIFGTGDVAKSRVVDMEPGLDTKTTTRLMLLLPCFSATWKRMLFHSNNP